MGLRVGVIVCATSFLLGCFLSHWIADSLTLWQVPLTDEHLQVAADYYAILSTMPMHMRLVFFVIGTISAIALLLNLLDGRAGNIMFDGGSVFLCFCALVVWVWSCLPNIEKLAPRRQFEIPFPFEYRKDILEIASKNLVCSVALTGVMLLQAGREWAEVKAPQPTAPVSSDTEKPLTEVQPSKSRGESAIAEGHLHPKDASELHLANASRSRRRSHHDHLEQDLDDSTSTASGSSNTNRSRSPRKRDNSTRKKRSVRR